MDTLEYIKKVDKFENESRKSVKKIVVGQDAKGDEMKTHELKITSKYMQELVDKTKTFELRKNDRGFKVGDNLILKEWSNNKYTGEYYHVEITGMLENYAGLEDGYCILSIK